MYSVKETPASVENVDPAVNTSPCDDVLEGVKQPPKREPYYERVPMVQKGIQRIAMKVLAPRTEEEKAMTKIPSTMNKIGVGFPQMTKYQDELQGGFKTSDNVLSIDRIQQETITQAKLRKPVNIDDKIIIQDQVAINLADADHRQLSDLDFSEQKEVLGTSTLLEQEAPPVISLVDVPPEGYDFKKLVQKDELSRQDMLQEFETTRGRGFKTKVSPEPFVLPSDKRSYNYVELVRKANANALFQDNIFNTSF